MNEWDKIEQDIFLFNILGGHLRNVTEDSVDNQISFIFEELCETIDAFESRDAVGLLDGYADLVVTVLGLGQKLKAAGFDTNEALKRVNENNLSKFPSDSANQPVGCVIGFNQQHNRYVFTNPVTGKVMKPTNFDPVSLNDLIPNDFFKGKSL